MDEALAVHQPCPDCGSSDALAIYENGSHCFSCEKHVFFNELNPRPKVFTSRLPTVRTMREFVATPWQRAYRNLDSKTLDLYGIQQSDSCLVFQYRDKDANVCARKWRTEDKSRVWWEGDNSSITGFGAHLANPSHHEAIAICEGEIDAPSIYQATGGKVVGISVPNGAAGAVAFIKKQLDFYLQFKVIYVATDMDEPGQKAAKDLVSLFDAGKVRRVVFPSKDANDTLQNQGSVAVRDCVMAARESRPDGIRPASDFQGLVNRPPQRTATDSAFGFWNQKTPFYDNQLIVLVAGSGVGKTTFARALAMGLMEKGKKVGWIGLEETVEESIFRFVGMAAGIQLHARDSYAGLSEEELQRIAQADKVITGSGRLELFDHFGSLDENSIMQRMAYMVRSLNCEFLFLDHLTILGSGLAQDTRHLDALVTKIRSFIASTKCTVIAINHLNRGSSQSKNMEDGGVPELHDIRGSHSIVQLADTIWALGRKRGDQTTHSYCLKNRMLGRCGYAGSFLFSEHTQILDQVWDEPGTRF